MWLLSPSTALIFKGLSIKLSSFCVWAISRLGNAVRPTTNKVLKRSKKKVWQKCWNQCDTRPTMPNRTKKKKYNARFPPVSRAIRVTKVTRAIGVPRTTRATKMTWGWVLEKSSGKKAHRDWKDRKLWQRRFPTGSPVLELTVQTLFPSDATEPSIPTISLEPCPDDQSDSSNSGQLRLLE